MWHFRSLGSLPLANKRSSKAQGRKALCQSLEKTSFDLTIALLKHQTETIFGTEALGIVADTLVDIAGENVQAKLEFVLNTNTKGQPNFWKLLKRRTNDFVRSV